MSNFTENEAAPIVSSLLRQGLIPTESEALGIIDRSEERAKGDAGWSLVGAAVGIASSCGILAASGATAPLVLPLGGLVGCAIAAWNSRQTEIDRQRESEFIASYPQLLTLIDHADNVGMNQDRIAAGYEQAFKAWRYGELASLDRYLSSQPQAEKPATIESVNQKNEVAEVAHPQTTAPQASHQAGQAQDAHPRSVIGAPTVEEHRFIDVLMGNPYQSRAIIAGQRTGKTYGAAVATYCLAQDGTEVFYINLFDHGQGNREAFSHARSVIGDLDKLTPSDAANLVDDAIDLIHQFKASNDAVLVVDEWLILGADNLEVSGLDELWRLLGNETSRLCSNGIGNGRAIWGIAPFFKASQLRRDALLLKECSPMVLSITPGHAVPWTNPRSGKITQVKAQSSIVGDVVKNWPGCGITNPTEEESRHWRRAGVERVYWNQGQWHPMGSCPSLPTPKVQPIPASVTAAPSIDDELPSLYEAVARMTVAQSFAPTDPALDLINNIPDVVKREAMTIAYRWAKGRIDGGNPVDRAAFIERARKERNCQYLVDNRDVIWEDLETLIE
jgi:hypothetical protein